MAQSGCLDLVLEELVQAVAQVREPVAQNLDPGTEPRVRELLAGGLAFWAGLDSGGSPAEAGCHRHAVRHQLS